MPAQDQGSNTGWGYNIKRFCRALGSAIAYPFVTFCRWVARCWGGDAQAYPAEARRSQPGSRPSRATSNTAAVASSAAMRLQRSNDEHRVAAQGAAVANAMKQKEEKKRAEAEKQEKKARQYEEKQKRNAEEQIEKEKAKEALEKAHREGKETALNRIEQQTEETKRGAKQRKEEERKKRTRAAKTDAHLAEISEDQKRADAVNAEAQQRRAEQANEEKLKGEQEQRELKEKAAADAMDDVITQMIGAELFPDPLMQQSRNELIMLYIAVENCIDTYLKGPGSRPGVVPDRSAEFCSEENQKILQKNKNIKIAYDSFFIGIICRIPNHEAYQATVVSWIVRTFQQRLLASVADLTGIAQDHIQGSIEQEKRRQLDAAKRLNRSSTRRIHTLTSIHASDAGKPQQENRAPAASAAPKAQSLRPVPATVVNKEEQAAKLKAQRELLAAKRKIPGIKTASDESQLSAAHSHQAGEEIGAPPPPYSGMKLSSSPPP